MDMPTQRGRRARRITCHDAHCRRQSVGLWAVPSRGIVVMVAPVADSARFDREQAISLRAALDEAIAELPSPQRERPVFPEGGGIRFYRVLTARIPGVGRCTTPVELVEDQLVLRPDTTTWFEVPLDYAAACCLLDALTGDTPGVVHVRHPSNGATTVTVALHSLATSLRVENASRGVLHIVFDETQLPQLIMHLEDGASWLPR